MNSRDLAFFFRDKMDLQRSSANFGSIGATNVNALIGTFTKWKREDGLTSAGIHTMIEVFALDDRWLKVGLPAWKVFVNNRAALAERASNLMEAHVDHDLGWVESRDLELEDDDEDLGWK